MPVSFRFATDVKSTITAIVAGTQTRLEINDFISLCHGFAITLLRRKIAAVTLETRFHYPSYRDMAYDCIAELFCQDEQGVIVTLKTYFEGFDIEGAENDEILAYVRRLVFSKVNQEIFRIYGELDPSLARILRNIKLAIQGSNGFVAVTRFGEWYILPLLMERNDQLPVIGPEDLERELSHIASGCRTTREMLSTLSAYVRGQKRYSSLVPLMTVARVFRSLYSRQESSREALEMDDGFAIAETRALITTTCASVKKAMEPRYAGRKKVSRKVLDDYFAVIEHAMLHRLIGEDGGKESLFERFKEMQPTLTRMEYYSRHRAIVEYLARLTHDRIVEKLRADA